MRVYVVTSNINDCYDCGAEFVTVCSTLEKAEEYLSKYDRSNRELFDIEVCVIDGDNKP